MTSVRRAYVTSPCKILESQGIWKEQVGVYRTKEGKCQLYLPENNSKKAEDAKRAIRKLKAAKENCRKNEGVECHDYMFFQYIGVGARNRVLYRSVDHRFEL